MDFDDDRKLRQLRMMSDKSSQYSKKSFKQPKYIDPNIFFSKKNYIINGRSYYKFIFDIVCFSFILYDIYNVDYFIQIPLVIAFGT